MKKATKLRLVLLFFFAVLVAGFFLRLLSESQRWNDVGLVMMFGGALINSVMAVLIYIIDNKTRWK